MPAKISAKKNPRVLPDVATEPHPVPFPEDVSAEYYAKTSPKDRLETRPPGTLPTPLDPASPEARGWPIDPKTDEDAGEEGRSA
jgi:hypothetical protein